MRPYDTVGRYGGEEFLILVPRCDHTFASYVAERIRAAIAAKPFRLGNQEIPFTMSLGVTSARGTADIDADSIVQIADSALYQAKDSGRNKVVVADLREVATS